MLLVESDEDLRVAYGWYLRKAGIDVDAVGDVPDAELALATTKYDAVVIAYRLASGDALNYLRERRAAGWQMPVLLLAGWDHVTDEYSVADLRHVDDQLVKPFPLDDLVERVRKLIQRAAAKAAQVLRVGDVEIDTARRRARRAGAPLVLTVREFAALELLAANQGQPVSHADLIGHVWSEMVDPPSGALAVVIGSLRRKLGPTVDVRRVADIGYRLTGQQSPAEMGLAFPVTIYLSDQSVHRQVQAAVEELIHTAGAVIVDRDEPVLGSWFRRMRARTRAAATSGLAREAATSAAHALDSRLVLAQDATVTATMMQNLGPVLASLQPTKDAVIRVGALLIVKVEWTVTVHQLTAAQQLVLDHHPQLLTSPHDILAALRPTTNSTATTSVAFATPPTTTPDMTPNTAPPLLSHNSDHPRAPDSPAGPT
ncbi:MAG TPA: response regulator transcription factor [Actinophytocola sp.]|uniref:response regulator transcription factor n=1 Tax=Actinophytocola sp. TaxID=1872138 RepID=UPI002DDCC7F8|nr:response regulator transcription factor [Actinophytocola sp.]HEV2780965.1 response regulator transcription factor [Actinophytocola sp.]